MARTPRTGQATVARDVQDLLRVMNRAEQDPSRDSASRDRLVEHLRGALSILMQPAVGKARRRSPAA